MTTRLLAGPTLVHEVGPESFVGSLRAVHARRLGELREALEPAQRPEAGVWSRWDAVRRVNHLLSAWFEPQRQRIDGACDRFQVGSTGLWTAAELVVALRWQLDHAMGLCHHPAEFSRITLKLQTVLEHWCREVEDTFSRVPSPDLWEEEHQEFRSLLGGESHHVTSLT